MSVLDKAMTCCGLVLNRCNETRLNEQQTALELAGGRLAEKPWRLSESGVSSNGVLQRQLRQIRDKNEKIGPSRVRRICVTLPGRTVLTPSLNQK